MLTILMAFFGIGGFIILCVAAGMNSGGWISKAADPDENGEHYQVFPKSNVRGIVWKIGIAFMAIAIVLAMIIKHS